MTKEQWIDLYSKLDKIYSDFLFAYPDYENGRNKQIRKDAERKVNNLISSADYLIRKDWEVYELLTGESNSDFGRTIIYDEFLMPRYFRNDMGDLLNKIKTKINNTNNE